MIPLFRKSEQYATNTLLSSATISKRYSAILRKNKKHLAVDMCSIHPVRLLQQLSQFQTNSDEGNIMTTVFIGGSRSITRLNDTIRYTADTIMRQRFAIVIGDANGADKAVQSYLAEKAYRNVKEECD